MGFPGDHRQLGPLWGNPVPGASTAPYSLCLWPWQPGWMLGTAGPAPILTPSLLLPPPVSAAPARLGKLPAFHVPMMGARAGPWPPCCVGRSWGEGSCPVSSLLPGLFPAGQLASSPGPASSSQFTWCLSLPFPICCPVSVLFGSPSVPQPPPHYLASARWVLCLSMARLESDCELPLGVPFVLGIRDLPQGVCWLPPISSGTSSLLPRGLFVQGSPLLNGQGPLVPWDPFSEKGVLVPDRSPAQILLGGSGC